MNISICQIPTPHIVHIPCMQLQFPQEALHLNLDVQHYMVEKSEEAIYL